VTGELVPEPELRLSDAEREAVVERLHTAVGEGRLTLAEFEERIDGVLAARTHAELAPFTAGLPVPPAGSDTVDLRVRASSLRRTGRWVVPRRLTLSAQSSSVRIDFTRAVISTSVVEMALDVDSSSVRLVLPPGASASIDEVEMTASSARARVPDGGGLHVVVRGRLHASNLRVRYPRRFLRWRW
jgi:hypothetical protein